MERRHGRVAPTRQLESSPMPSVVRRVDWIRRPAELWRGNRFQSVFWLPLAAMAASKTCRLGFDYSKYLSTDLTVCRWSSAVDLSSFFFLFSRIGCLVWREKKIIEMPYVRRRHLLSVFARGAVVFLLDVFFFIVTSFRVTERTINVFSCMEKLLRRSATSNSRACRSLFCHGRLSSAERRYPEAQRLSFF